MRQEAQSSTYKMGDSDQRPWGHYVVTMVGSLPGGEQFCTKRITLNPHSLLSLQSHELRHETWTVISGQLTVIIDDERITLGEGESIDVPQRAIHTMANLSDKPCVVHEVQEGQCAENDITRYSDANGRPTERIASLRTAGSFAHYADLIKELDTLTKK